MRRVIALLWTLFLVSHCAAQGKPRPAVLRPDFSGNWVLNHDKSDLGPLQRTMGKAEIILVITHRDPELKIARRGSLNGREQSLIMIYYTDERGETNSGLMGSRDIKSRTKWDKTKLLSTSSTAITSPRGKTTYLNSTEKTELSADGNTLTIMTTISSQVTMQVIRQVYTRAQ